MDKRCTKPKSTAIKNYFDKMLPAAGLTAKDLAGKMNMSAVHLCNLSYRLDQMTAERLADMAKFLGIPSTEFIAKILELRANELDA